MTTDNNRKPIIFRKAGPDEAEAVMRLYSSLIGTPGCTWNEFYPDIDLVRQDISRSALFVAMLDGEIAAAAAYEDRDDLFELDIWSACEKPFALARVAVKTGLQRRGIASGLIAHMAEYLESRGYDSARLLVCPRNLPALALYFSLGFVTRGEADMYGMHWLCCEKVK